MGCDCQAVDGHRLPSHVSLSLCSDQELGQRIPHVQNLTHKALQPQTLNVTLPSTRCSETGGSVLAGLRRLSLEDADPSSQSHVSHG